MGKRTENLKFRVLAGLPALALLVVAVWFAPLPALGVVGLVVSLCAMHEYVVLLEGSAEPAPPRTSLYAGAALVGLAAFPGDPVVLAAGLFLALWLHGLPLLLGNGAEDGRVLRSVGTGVLGLVWIAWGVGHLVLLVHLPGGRPLLMMLVLALVLGDSLAYAVGTLVGRHALAPRISPNKTLEGALGGLAGGGLAGWAAALWLAGPAGGGLGRWDLVLVGVVLAALGQVGDLLESRLKRLTGAGDSGRFLPGHGGLLDRLDSFLVAGPCLYYYSAFVGG